MDIKNQLSNVFENLVTQIQEQITQELVEFVQQRVSDLDFRTLVREQVGAHLAERIKDFTFPENSIPSAALKLDGFELTGDHIRGGIIKNFGSTGIDDQATKCQLTILDTHVVVEAPILTTGIDIRGDATVSGNLVINGEIDTTSSGYTKFLDRTVDAVKDSLNEELFVGFSDLITNNIRDRGIDFSEVLINGKLVLSESKLGPSVTTSHLRQVGELTELQVRGESYLSKTLYITEKRVGINTLEPSSALSVWDEEVEIVAAKLKQGIGYFGSKRPVGMVLGANSKENISLDIDGSVTINDLRLGALPLSTASMEPNWSGRAGEIVFNDSPGIGKPIGWVCLDGTRWGFFGLIQE